MTARDPYQLGLEIFPVALTTASLEPDPFIMKFISHQLTFQEVPDEVSLSFLISGCSLRCPGCHSSFAWDANQGENLSVEVLRGFLRKFTGLISCVCFLGGEWYEDELFELCHTIQEAGLKTCLYTGLEDVSPRLKSVLDYLKVGRYEKEKGGLGSRTTNQRMIDLRTNTCLNEKFLKQGELNGKAN